MKAPHNTVEPLLDNPFHGRTEHLTPTEILDKYGNYISNRDISALRRLVGTRQLFSHNTFRGYCSVNRLKPNLKAYVKYAKQPPPVQVEYTYQWYRDGKPIPGATSSGYTLTKEDKGCKITCKTVPNAIGGIPTIKNLTKAYRKGKQDYEKYKHQLGPIPINGGNYADMIIGGAFSEQLMKSIDDKFIGLTDKQEFELRNKG